MGPIMEPYNMCHACGEKTSTNFSFCQKCGTKVLMGNKTIQKQKRDLPPKKQEKTDIVQTPIIKTEAFKGTESASIRKNHILEESSKTLSKLRFSLVEEDKILTELEQLRNSPFVGRVIALLLKIEEKPSLSAKSKKILSDFTNHNNYEVKNMTKRILLKRFGEEIRPDPRITKAIEEKMGSWEMKSDVEMKESIIQAIIQGFTYDDDETWSSLSFKKKSDPMLGYPISDYCTKCETPNINKSRYCGNCGSDLVSD